MGHLNANLVAQGIESRNRTPHNIHRTGEYVQDLAAFWNCASQKEPYGKTFEMDHAGRLFC